MEFFNTAVQFLKLEKVEIGGIRGKALTNSISKVSEEFKDLYSVFSLKTYDSLDPKDLGFLKDNERYKYLMNFKRLQVSCPQIIVGMRRG